MNQFLIYFLYKNKIKISRFNFLKIKSAILIIIIHCENLHFLGIRIDTHILEKSLINKFE